MYDDGYCHGLCMSIDGIEDIDGVCPMWTWTGAEAEDGVEGEGGCGEGCRAGSEVFFRGGEEG